MILCTSSQCFDIFIVIFILRLYAIYGRSRLVVYASSCLLVCELVIKIVSLYTLSLANMSDGSAYQWAFTDGVRLALPPGKRHVLYAVFHLIIVFEDLAGCILTGKSHSYV